MRGRLLTPGEPDYNKARVIFNGMFDRRPALIARCRGVADVIDAVRFARRHHLLTAVRAGGSPATASSSKGPNRRIAVPLGDTFMTCFPGAYHKRRRSESPSGTPSGISVSVSGSYTVRRKYAEKLRKSIEYEVRCSAYCRCAAEI